MILFSTTVVRDKAASSGQNDGGGFQDRVLHRQVQAGLLTLKAGILDTSQHACLSVSDVFVELSLLNLSNVSQLWSPFFPSLYCPLKKENTVCKLGVKQCHTIAT